MRPIFCYRIALITFCVYSAFSLPAATTAYAQDATATEKKATPFSSTSLPALVTSEFNGLAARGNATMRFFGLKVYDVTLFSKAGAALAAKPYEANAHPFVLELIYDIGLKGAAISERSVQEMRKQGHKDDALLQKWQTQMTQVFPDIKSGDVLIGVAIPGKEARFYNRTKLIGTIADSEFVAAFFDIWLSPKSSEPKLREKLIGNIR
jgi:Chalcone isomerase-like